MSNASDTTHKIDSVKNILLLPRIASLLALLAVSCCQSASADPAKAVVRIRAGDSYASGTIIKRTIKGGIILAVADHMFTSDVKEVCIGFNRSSISLPGRVIYRGGSKIDIALVIAKFADHLQIQIPFISQGVRLGQSIRAVGFTDRSQIMNEAGTVSLMLAKSIKGGYSIGTSANIQKGMSGGGIFDADENLVGIISTHADPLWESDIYFTDNSKVPKEITRQVSSFSMAINIKDVIGLLKSYQLFEGRLSRERCSL